MDNNARTKAKMTQDVKHKRTLPIFSQILNYKYLHTCTYVSVSVHPPSADWLPDGVNIISLIDCCS